MFDSPQEITAGRLGERSRAVGDVNEMRGMIAGVSFRVQGMLMASLVALWGRLPRGAAPPTTGASQIPNYHSIAISR